MQTRINWDDASSVASQFDEKTLILETLCEQVKPEDIYEDIFWDLEIEVPLRLLGDSEKKIRKLSVEDAITLSCGKSDAILSACTFINNYPKKSLIADVYALKVDIDYVSSDALKSFIASGFTDKTTGISLPPNYIVNSGKGIHLYYTLSEPFFYPSDRDYFQKLNDELTLFTGRLTKGHPDKRPIEQGFRMPGSLNRQGKVIKAYKYLPRRWELEDLAAALKFSAETHKSRDELRSRAILSESQAFQIAERSIPEPWDINRRWYDSDLKRCAEEVNEGHRYKSFMALTAIAYKCNVPREELQRDLENLTEIYNAKSHLEPIKKSEIAKALLLYNRRATIIKSQTLEEWLGYKYVHENRHRYKSDGKRYPRKKTEAMRAAGLKTNIEARGWEKRDELYPDGSWRKNAGRKTLKDKVIKYREENPSASISKCSKDTGINRKTVSKWWNCDK